MFYFEVIAAYSSSMVQRATTTALGPFVVEAVHESAARMLVGINYATDGPSLPCEAVSAAVWDDPSACDVTRLPFPPGSLRPRQALVAGRDRAGDDLAQPELVSEGRMVARMIWWPCAGPDIYPFGDALLFSEQDVDGFARESATV